jgi:hypothetical protein
MEFAPMEFTYRGRQQANKQTHNLDRRHDCTFIGTQQGHPAETAKQQGGSAESAEPCSRDSED